MCSMLSKTKTLTRKFLRWKTVKKAVKFWGVGFIGLIIGNVLFYIFAHWLGLWDQLALNLATIFAAIENFVGNVLNGNIKLDD